MSIKSESGRSMIEMIAVIGVVIVLTMGALTGYKQVVASHQAISLHEDILVQAQAQKGHNYRNKSIYDSGIGKKTRMGLRMDAAKAENGDTFSIVVQNVATDTCSYLIKKDWKDAVRLKINNLIYTPQNIECVSIKESGQEKFTFEVIFPKTKASVSAFERTCDQCMSCEECNSTMNICVNACPDSAQFCQDNRCVFSHCPTGHNLDNGNCVACKAGYACSSCAEISNTKLVWDGEKCVCSDDTCGKGKFCSTSGECDWCPENATCPEGVIVCDENYYQSGDTCTLCPENATCEESGAVIPNPGYSMEEGEIQSCTAGTICEGCQQADETRPIWNGETCCVDVNNYKADGSETTNGTMCCPAGYSSAVDGTCCKDSEPYCKAVNYLQSDGNQWIDTETKGNINTKVEIKCQDNRSSSIYGNIFGYRKSSTSENIELLLDTALNTNIDFGSYTNTRLSTPTTAKTTYIWYTDRYLRALYDENRTLLASNTNTYSTEFITTGNLLLYSIGGTPYNNSNFIGKIYYTQIYDNDVLVRDFIPVIDKNGRAGMYDKVEKEMYYNQGTGQFSAG